MAEGIRKKSDNQENIKRKPRKRKRPVLRFLIFVCSVTVFVVFLMSDFFTVTKIDVKGNHYYTVSQIKDISQLKTGYNLFKTKTKNAKKFLLEDPYIKLVSIKKVPRGTIRIEITEREEKAAVPFGNQYVLIDGEGMVLRIADSLPALPVLEGMTLVEMTPGLPLKVEESYLLSDTLELISEVEESDLYFKKIYFSTVIVRAYIYDEFYCEGTPSNMTANMDKVKLLVEELYGQGIEKGVIKVGKDNYLTYSPRLD